MSKFDHKNKIVTTDWLTSVLKQNGYLESGQVVKVDQKTLGASNTSEFFEISIQYSDANSGKRPETCLMKLSKPERFAPCQREALFYEFMRIHQSPSVLNSYATSIDKELQSVVILMHYKTDASRPSENMIPPDIRLCEQAVRALARFHAHWWKHPELENITTWLDSGLSVLNVTDELVLKFIDRLGDALSPARRKIIEHSFEYFPVVYQKHKVETRRQTIVHGDSHFWNFLFPEDPTQNPTLIDWQSWNVDFCARDLAYMIALYWFPERRVRYEERMLNSYLDELNRCDIHLTFEELWNDYRLCVAGLVLYPCFQGPTRIWWHQMERLFCAFEDLDCYEVLDQ